MHRQDRLRALRDGCLNGRRVNVVGSAVNVHKDRPGPAVGDSVGSGDEGEGGGDYLIFRANAQRRQRQAQGICSRSYPYAIFAPTVG